MLTRVVASVVIVVTAIAGLAVAGSAGTAPRRDPGPFAGLGAWVDAFDYAPAFQGDAGAVTVTPDAVPDMAALGVETLFLQAAMNDATRAPDKIIDRQLVGEILRRAHRAGMQVVAWYYPTLEDPASDLAHVQAMADFTYRGQRFDALALDIEAIQTIKDVDERNDAVVKLAKQTRALVGDAQPLGAAVYPAVQAEVVNPALWPRFPYKRLAKHVDVWMPMAYWTYRDGDYRDAYRYTEESIRRLRANLDDKRATMHPIGGLAAESSAQDYDAFLRAVYDTRSVGWSMYDYSTMFTSAWPRMRTGGVPTTTTTTPPPPTTRAR
jgi:hypothetical protein